MKKKVEEEMSISSFLKILAGVIIVFIVFMGITNIVTNKKDNVSTEQTIQYKKILVGSILNRPEEEYFVLVEAKDDNVATYETLIAQYTVKENHHRFYTVDLTDGFNEKYVADENKVDVTKVDDLRFAETTLLHIKNGKITSARVGDNISVYLKNLSA